VSQFAAENFFGLEGFAHAGLFEEGAPVWRALANIGPYLQRTLKPGIHPGAVIMEGAILIGPDLQIGAGCVIEAGAFLRGPIILGRECEVRHGAYLRGGIIAGDGCVFGHASEFKNAALLDGAKAPHFNYVGDSILGASVNMGAGSKLSNVKVTHGNVLLSVEREGGSGAERIDSGLRKFGAIIGDRVEIGCNAVLNPGTLIGPDSMVYPNASVRGFYGPGTIIKLRQSMEATRKRKEEGR